MGTLMNIQCVSLLCLFLLNINASHGQTSSLQPPAGNSLKLKSKAKGGTYAYKCDKGALVLVSASASLVDISNSSALLGNYSLVYDPANPKFVGTWDLINNDAEAAESGSLTSSVKGNEIASESGPDSKSITQDLAEASSHIKNGIASQISYIQRVNTTGGLPPKGNGCSKNTVPFEAEFWFYTQDLEPPSVPAAIAVPSGQQMVQGFFGKGTINYTFNGSKWTPVQTEGKLYNVPGGGEVGSFHSKGKQDIFNGSFYLETANPNGWTVVGSSAASSTSADDPIPWSLFKITTSSGNVALLGPFKSFQLVGTRGQSPPNSSKVTSWKGEFSAQFWIYK